MVTIFRIIFTAALLIVVWLNVHWSVALILTLDAISWEYLSFGIRKLAYSINQI